MEASLGVREHRSGHSEGRLFAQAEVRAVRSIPGDFVRQCFWLPHALEGSEAVKCKVGDTVHYYECLGDKTFETREVDDVLPGGIPSCRKPMVHLKDKAGYVLESHCFPVPAADHTWVPVDDTVQCTTCGAVSGSETNDDLKPCRAST